MSSFDHAAADHTRPEHTLPDQPQPDRSAAVAGSATVPTAPFATAPAAPFATAPAPAPATATHAPAGAPVLGAQPVEIVPRGILWSLAAIPLGMLASVLIWKLGYVASISSFLIAGLATWLYAKGAGAVPRRGLVPLVGVIVAGVVLSFLAIVAADIVDYHGTPEGQALGYPSALDMVAANLFDPKVLGSYGSDLLMFVVFAALGIFGTLRRLLRSRG